MSENETGDDRDPSRAREPQIGLSFPREEDGESPGNARPRRRANAYENLQQATRIDEGVVARWFLPLSILFLLLLLIGIAIFLVQNSRVSELEQRVATLMQQASSDASNPGLDRIRERLTALEDRSSDGSANPVIEALRQTLSEQSDRIETLSGRLDKLAKPAAASGGSESTTSSTSASASGQAGGGWVINLITVADRTAAQAVQERLGKLGVQSRLQSVTIDDKPLLRVVVAGFESRDAAESAGANLKKELELSDDPWITRQ